MIKQLREIVILIFILPVTISGQSPDAGPDYQMIMFGNPGLTGAEGNGFIRLSYTNFYPGNGYNLFSGAVSYDGYFPSLHGGAGLFISNDYMGGIVNDLQTGLSYAYYFQAGKDLYISAGLSASIYQRYYNFSGSLLPDQIIDPLGGFASHSVETLVSEKKNVLDLGTGFLFITSRMFCGFSVNHLTQPDLDVAGGSEGKLGRKLLAHAAFDFDLNKERNLKIRPLSKFEIMKDYFSVGAGTVLESEHLAANVVIFGDKEKNFDMQAGFDVEIGNFELFYNYRFNIASGSNLLPFSLLHRTGIVLGLNNVDKRRIIKTIKYPNL